MAVEAALFKSGKAHSVQEHAGFFQHLNILQQCLALVLCNEFPRVEAVAAERVAQAVIVTGAHQGIVLVEFLDLLFYLPFVIVRYPCDIQLIAECSHHSDMTPCLERRYPAHAVIGAVRNVRSEAGAGIAQGSAVLYFKPFYRVSVVGAPYLRRVIQHTCVKPRTAAGAVFKQQIGEIGEQPLLDLVNAEDVSVPYFALSFRGEYLVSDLAELAVHVPLDILDIRRGQYLVHLLVDVVAHVFSGEVYDKLRTAGGARSAGDMYAPVGVRLVQLAVRRDHLRLEPDAEFQPQLVHLVHQVFQTTLYFVLVHEPVAQT